MPINIIDFAFAGHPVTDMPRARKFYEETLGLKPARAIDLGSGQFWIEYEFRSGTLAISNSWPPGGSGATTTLETDDLAAAFAHCEAAGVTFSFAIMDTPVCRFFGIKDPDGNDIALHQRKTALN